MSVRCKFKCDNILISKDGSEVTLSPVVQGSAENNSFFKYTPYGSFKFGTVNADSASYFIPGEEYYIDINLVTKD